jgi:K+-transporting ATPase ATPase C chain
LRLFLLLTALTGLAFPLSTIAAAALLFPHQAAGSPVRVAGPGTARVVGSELLGQELTGPRYFWGRPSATPDQPANSERSGGSNGSFGNPALAAAAVARAAALHAGDPGQALPIPGDLVTASASGLDPDISLAAARWQVPRVARERNLPESDVAALVDELALPRRWAFLGEPRVNVLRLNLALDAAKAKMPQAEPRHSP